MNQMVNEEIAMEYFGKLDKRVSAGTELFVFGGSAIGLLGAKVRTTIDIDIAAPYSRVNLEEFRKASAELDFPVNPDPSYQGAFIEFVGPARLSMPTPADGVQVLYRGLNLTVKTGSIADLIASKLVRYNIKDMQDIQFLISTAPVKYEDVETAVARLSLTFRNDPLVKENLENLKTDMELWRETK